MNNTSTIDLDDPAVVAYWRDSRGVAQELLQEIVSKVGRDPAKVSYEVALKMAAALGTIQPRN
jgi:hypothetical protein